MKLSKNVIIAIELIAIIFLIAFIVIHLRSEVHKKEAAKTGLLSQRVYSEILPPQNHLVFNLDPLADALTEQIEASNLNVSFYIVNMRTGAQTSLHGDEEFNPLSLNKLPIAILILRKIERGELSFDSQIKIENRFASSGSGDLYNHVGESYSIRQLMHAMLSQSDNTASFALLDKIPISEIAALSIYLDYYQVPNSQSTVSEASKFLLTNSKANYALFTSLYLSTVLNPEDSEYLLSELTNTSFDIKKFADLPEDVIIAQKYGEEFSNGQNRFNSCGIMYSHDDRFFFCIMTKNLDSNQARMEVGRLVNGIYQYVNETSQRKLEI